MAPLPLAPRCARAVARPRRVAVALLAAAGFSTAQDSCVPGQEGPNGLCQVLAADGASGAGTLELLQRHQSGQKLEQIPGLGDLVDSAQKAANDAMDTITDQANEAVEGAQEAAKAIASKAVEDAGKAATAATTSAALLVASTVNQSFIALGKTADTLTQVCMEAKSTQLQTLEATKMTAKDRLEALEAQATATVGKILPFYRNATVQVTAVGGVASSALAALGHEDLGDELTSVLESAMAEANAYVVKFQNVTQLVQNLSDLAEDAVMPRLRELNRTVEESVASIQSYAGSLTKAFDDFTDKAATTLDKAIPGVNMTAVNEAFDSVDETASMVVDHLVQGPMNAAVSVSTASGLAEQALPESVRGNTVRAGLSLLGLGFALAAHVVA